MAVSVIDALVTTLTLDASQYIANAQRQREANKAMSADERQFVKDMQAFNAEKERNDRDAARKEAEIDRDRERERKDQIREEKADEREKQRAIKETETQQDKAAKEAEAAGKKQEEAFKKVVKQAVIMLGVFTAGKGIKDFVLNLVSSDAAAGRLAKNIGMNVEELSRWQGIATQMGGSGEGVSRTFETWADDINDFNMTGQSTILPLFNLIGVKVQDVNGRMKDFGQIARDIASSPAFQAMTRPAQASYLKNLGVDEGMANAIMSGPAALNKGLGDQPVISKEDAERAIEFDANLNKLINTSKSLGRVIFNDVAPQLNHLLDAFDALMKKDGPKIASEIGAAMVKLADDLKIFPWKETIEEGEAFAKTVNMIVEAIGGWGRATEILFGLWAASKVVGITSGILGLANALTGGGATGSLLASVIRLAGPLDRLLLAIGPLGAFAIGMTPGSAGGTEDAAIRERKAYEKGLNPDGSPLSPEQKKKYLSHGDTPVPQVSLFDRYANMIGRGKGRVSADELNNLQPLFNLIGKSEGTDKGKGYNESLGYGKWTDGPQDLSKMTLDQIDALQTSMLNKQIAAGVDPKKASSALGRYQFIRTTLREIREKYQLDGSQLFDKKTQDQLAALRIRMAGSDDPATLAKIWASLPKNQGDRGGEYGQGTHVTYSEVQEALRKVHSGAAADPRYTNASAAAPGGNSQVNVDTINIHTQATDANGIARDIQGGMARNAAIRQANTGVVN
jgi:muramidase (phage lysozyme)